MANHTAIIAWLESHVSKLDFNVTESTWIQDWFPGIRELKVELNLQNKTFVGHGTARNADLALVKAFTEAFERAVKHTCALPNTSGLAGHESVELAKRNATWELIERDAFFCHFLTNTPFLQIPSTQVSASTLLNIHEIETRLRKMGVTIKLGRMNTSNDKKGTICVCFGENAKTPFGLVVGLGCRDNLEHSIEHSIFECLTNVIAIQNGEACTSLSPDEFMSLSKPNVDHHFAIGLHLSSAKQMRQLFESEKSDVLDFQADICWRELPTEQLGLGKLPIHFVLAESSELQPAFFGHLVPEKINLSRINKFSERQIGLAELPQFPHPLG